MGKSGIPKMKSGWEVTNLRAGCLVYTLLFNMILPFSRLPFTEVCLSRTFKLW